ncbi:hypothetical protein F4680DRAFT_448144 [Xylaria scruposa]|nr:hypothetical protein F4680DRAFT_448144 [Xylaria scruposa]
MRFALENSLTSQTPQERTPPRNRKRSWKRVTSAGSPLAKHLHSRKWRKPKYALSRKLSREHGGSAYPQQIDLQRQHDLSGISQLSAESSNDDENISNRNPSTNPFSTPTTRRLLFPPTPSRSAPALLERNRENVFDRPRSRKREKSDMISQDVDDKITEVLLKRLSKTELKKDKIGKNYLFEVVPAGDTERVVVKIGHTTMSEERRMRAISNRCNHFSMEREADPEGRLIYLYQKAEKLMQAELYDCTYNFSCDCGEAHREYFDVDKTTAREVIRRWRAFCELEPYDANGILRPFWEQRLRDHNTSYRKNDDQYRGLSEQEERRLRWQRFTTPTQLEKLSFNITYFGARACQVQWEDIASIEALVIFVLYPSELASGWFGIILIFYLFTKFSKRRSSGK